MGPDGHREFAPPAAPWWLPVAQAVIRRLPAGRFRAAARLARLAPAPFVARLPHALGGARFWCDLQDEIARDACMAGAYEPQVSHVLRQLLAPGMTVLDVGANWGYFTLLASGLVGPVGRVVALEPDPRMFRLLERNIALNGFSQTRPLPLAAAERSGTAGLQGYMDGTANRGVSRLRGGDVPGLLEVRAVTLDDVRAGERLERVDLLKIDVEGYEDGVLQGMQESLHRGAFQRILIELHPALLAERGRTPGECCKVLRAAGYEGWTFDHSRSAQRRAAYGRGGPRSALLRRSDEAPPGDPWPHMLWIKPGVRHP
jgi:FkbM family methyltransferase